MQKICEYCQLPFAALRITKKYCSDNCKQLAYYERNGFPVGKNSHDSLDVDDNITEDTVTAGVNVKCDKESEMSQALVNAIAERVIEVIGERLLRATVKSKRKANDYRKTFSVNRTESQSETASGFTVKCEKASVNFCYPKSHAGFSSYINQTRGDHQIINRANVNYDKPITVNNAAKNQQSKAESVPAFTVKDEIMDEKDSVNSHSSDPFTRISAQDADINDGNHLNVNQYRKTGDRPAISSDKTYRKTKSEKQCQNFENDLLSEALNLESLLEQAPKPDHEVLINEAEKSVAVNVKQDTVKYQWIRSYFNDRVNDHLTFNNFEEYFHEYKKEGDYENLSEVKAMKVFKCLIRNIIRLSDYPQIDQKILLTLSESFAALKSSHYFNSLPDNFTNCFLINKLDEKLRTLTKTYRNHRQIRLRMTPEMRMQLIAANYGMCGYVQDVKFSEIFGQT